ncbi:hypothetical protein [Clostridium amazonitimonense]|uniref:hypothetical protein n=1 Tax=Clostridium amazonitimonense TaxID=1499689 RepID=UPI00068C40A4|nr:hypothetical protein [Clostridium amazonitimonense]
MYYYPIPYGYSTMYAFQDPVDPRLLEDELIDRNINMRHGGGGFGGGHGGGFGGGHGGGFGGAHGGGHFPGHGFPGHFHNVPFFFGVPFFYNAPYYYDNYYYDDDYDYYDDDY